ncbi:peptidase, partial [Flavobacteriaceae bacterium LYZ1037]
MKKNYIHSFMVVGLLFFGLMGFSQNSLVNSEYGNVIKTYLTQNQAKYHLTANDIEDLYVTKEYFSKSTKINHVYVNQRYQGIEIHNAISSVAMRDHAVFYYANNLIGNISQKVNTISPQINAQRAIENVVTQLNLGSLQGLELISGNNKEFLFTNGNVSRNNIPVKLVYYYSVEQDDLKLAWDLSIQTKDGSNWWSVRVDAVTGQVLEKNNWVVSCNFGDGNHANHTDNSNHQVVVQESFSLFKPNAFVADGSQYNVFAFPVEAPSFGGRTLLDSPADDNASPYGWHDTNGAAGAEFTITRGNNVYAYEDTANQDVPGASPDGGATLNFDFTLNINQEPVGYQDVSVTNMFYVSNMMHDVWYQYGFDEASGNFQENNYGNGGLGSDYVEAEGQDGGGTNNANFGTGPDGQNPYMQMYLWSEPPGEALVINDGSLAGGYIAEPATFGANLPTTPLTANLAIVVDNVNDPNDGCNPLTNAAELNGKIVVIRRGECEFGFKAKAAQDEGAVGVVIVNNVPGGTIAMGGGVLGGSVTIPAVMVDNIDGEAIIAALLAGDIISASLVNPNSYQRDGSFDNGIIAHEYGHGISNRLTGGAAAAGCLNNAEQMGEGWSDWFGLMLTMKPGDEGTDARGIGTYATGQPTTGVGIRNAPYSTDFAVNDFTYNDTNDTANVAAP